MVLCKGIVLLGGILVNHTVFVLALFFEALQIKCLKTEEGAASVCGGASGEC